MRAPKGYRKEVISERTVEVGEMGSGNYACSREYVYALICNECGVMVWMDDRAAQAHQKMHRDLKVAPMGLGSILG